MLPTGYRRTSPCSSVSSFITITPTNTIENFSKENTSSTKTEFASTTSTTETTPSPEITAQTDPATKAETAEQSEEEPEEEPTPEIETQDRDLRLVVHIPKRQVVAFSRGFLFRGFHETMFKIVIRRRSNH